jgi:hypothetical protein
MTLIETKTLGTAAASIEFTSIPQDFTDLMLLMSPRSTRNTGNLSDVYIQFNSTTSGYSHRLLAGYDGSVSTDTRSGTTNKFYPFDAPQANWIANTFGNASIYIPNYSGSTNKSVSFDAVTERDSAASGIWLTAGLWSNTAAITSIQFSIISGSNYEVGTTISLYGITKGSDGIVTTS